MDSITLDPNPDLNPDPNSMYRYMDPQHGLKPNHNYLSWTGPLAIFESQLESEHGESQRLVSGQASDRWKPLKF